MQPSGCANWRQSTSAWYLPDLTERLGLAGYFAHMIVSARVGVAKPHPQAFHHLLDRFGTTPQRVLHVGDNLLSDVDGAQGVGMSAVLLDRSSGDHSDGVDYPVIHSLDEVLNLV